MSDLDFYAQAATANVVLGVSLGSVPEEVQNRFGADFIDDRRRGVLRRDYGLLEFSFFRDIDWKCGAIGIQVHRLLWADPDAVPSALIVKYGDFANRLTISSLKDVISDAGFELDEVSGQDGDEFIQFCVVQSGVEIIVVGCPMMIGGASYNTGDVWSIHISGTIRPIQ
ncbi:hypothetical protein [Rhizohabitans arisaemae]|uniref:hypothetical protein n=1 Tax=Rhizohabitans arisaemae TaxID=2720610 RepID=UPI0024B0F5BF|nr:hypothetical protein [Rhizohabitans arisaemae]